VGERGAARAAGVSMDALWPKEWTQQGGAGAQAAAGAAMSKGRGADAAAARPKAPHGKLHVLVAQADAQERAGGQWQGWGAGGLQGRGSSGGQGPTRGALWWCAPMRQLKGPFCCRL